ncbi:MAG: hypothetical protein IPJ41_00760 [Phycisphaerales bacterium]|nr:hypothetical protein [Phycisphaerales bacterium]
MPILPLPQFEEDVQAYEAELAAEHAKLKAPKTLVVRFGSMKLIGEFPYEGSVKPGCGSKVVVRTHRGTELGEMLTSTCSNGGCGKSISRQQMLEYVERSGGKDYPFFSQGRVLRIASMEDMDAQAALEQSKHELVRRARDVANRLRIGVKMVEAEQLLGGERVIYYYLSEERVDLRELHRELNSLHAGRADLRQVGARDEARLVADYERCGQHCCCKNFLKVLKPISMRSAKTQKATLEPLKISGRCGRLMCCLRYEDETYEDLRKRLPPKKKRVGTPHGDGFVLSGQILTQLVLVRLDGGTDVAVPVENLAEPGSATPPPPREDRRSPDRGRPGTDRPMRDRPPRERPVRERPPRERPQPEVDRELPREAPAEAGEADGLKKKRRRRRKKRPGEGAPAGEVRQGGEERPAPTNPRPPAPPRSGGPEEPGGEGEGVRKKKRRRRRKKRPDGGPGGDGGASGGDGPADA